MSEAQAQQEQGRRWIRGDHDGQVVAQSRDAEGNWSLASYWFVAGDEVPADVVISEELTTTEDPGLTTAGPTVVNGGGVVSAPVLPAEPDYFGRAPEPPVVNLALPVDPDVPQSDSGTAEPPAPGLAFEPAGHNVDEVNEYLDAHPEDVERVLALEAAGKRPRAGILAGPHAKGGDA